MQRKPTDPRLADELAASDDSVINRALAWSLIGIGLVGGLASLLVYIIFRPSPPPEATSAAVVAPQPKKVLAVELPSVPLVDITIDAGIDFVHHNGAVGEKLLPETMGSGCALFDYDNDGDCDILFVNGMDWPHTERKTTHPPTMALYRNDGKAKFDNVTEEAGLDVPCYGMGAAIGDFDNDGWTDLYLTAVGKNRLFRNQEGRFVDVTESSGTAGSDDQWSTSAAFADYDNDGDLDLFVCNYVKWNRELDLAQEFKMDGVGRAYGPPVAFEGTYPYLFRNDGSGKFTEVAGELGLHVQSTTNLKAPLAKALGVAPIDFDRDGRIDFIVANDTVQNLVFHNQGDKFEEIGNRIGVAFDTSGGARGAMGISAAYFRNNNALGIAIGNFSNEMTALYVSQNDPMQFSDVALATGLGPQTRLQLTFGMLWMDIDLDGRLDLFSVNGHIEEDINKVQKMVQHAQPPMIYWNCGRQSPREFERLPAAKVGEDFGQPLVGRGSATADLDGDGDLDLVITACGGRPRILRNDVANKNGVLRFQLEGTRSNRSAIGAWIEVRMEEDVYRRQVMPTHSYLSQSELPVTIGVGPVHRVERVIVHWPSGEEMTLKENLSPNQTVILKEDWVEADYRPFPDRVVP